MSTLVDLTHPIHIGQVTHPGLPAPQWEPFRSREEYHASTGTTFQVDRLVMVGNTGTYLDSPFHRYADGDDLAALPLTAVADLPIVVVDARNRRAVTPRLLHEQLGHPPGGLDLTGCAVLLHTNGDLTYGTPAYGEHAPYLNGPGAQWLADRGPALVGIDAVNIDALEDPARPAHTCLLARDVLVLEHLTHLGDLAGVPPRTARLHAAPPPWHQIGTWPVRAYAVIHDDAEGRKR